MLGLVGLGMGYTGLYGIGWDGLGCDDQVDNGLTLTGFVWLGWGLVMFESDTTAHIFC